VSDPIGWDGQGKTVSFIFQRNPTRAVAAATGTIYRVTVQDTTLLNTPTVEYWLDVVRGMWSGPHRFANNSAPQAIDSFNNTFITSIAGVPAKLWQSDPYATPSSTFVENGTQLTWSYLTSFLPDTDHMAELNMLETTITMGVDQNTSYPVNWLDQNGGILGSATIFIPAVVSVPAWGGVTWGAFTWGPARTSLFPRPVNWPRPVVFRRGQFAISGNSSANVKMGTVHCRYEELGYLQQSIVA
jgi:hypothetical protein